MNGTVEESEEVVYSPSTMSDKELEKLLNYVGNKIIDGVKQASVPSATTPLNTNRIATWQMGLGMFVSALVIIGSIWAGLNYVVSSAITTGLVQTGKDLATLTEQGKGLRKDVDRLLDKIAATTLTGPQKSGNSLAAKTEAIKDIKEATIRAHDRGLLVPRERLTDIGQELLKVGTASTSPLPDAWSAFSEVVNYRTDLDAATNVSATVTTMQRCSAFPPKVYTDSGGKGVNYVQNAPFTYDGCYLDMDKPDLPEIVTHAGGIGMRCNKCVVSYSGGPITFRAELVNCLFLLKLDFKPTEKGLRLAEAILKDPKSVRAG